MRYLSLIALFSIVVLCGAIRAQDDVSSSETEKKAAAIVKRDVAKEAAGYKTDGLQQSVFKDDVLRKFHASNVADFVAVDGNFGASRIPLMHTFSFRLIANGGAQEASQTSTPKVPPVSYFLASRDLIGLLTHPSPVAYSAPNIKTFMFNKTKSKAVDAPTRALDEFETKALEQLRAGQDLVMEKSDDSVRLIGSIRASTDCMSCHEVKSGDLLGAFSYRLKPKLEPRMTESVTADATQPGRYRQVLKDHGLTKILKEISE